MQGDVVRLFYSVDEGYAFVGWVVVDENGDPVEVTNNTFVMPASNVTVTAVFEPTAPAPRPGDVDGDGVLTFADIGGLYAFILGGGNASLGLEVGDMNDDGEITFADVGALYSYILGS